MDSRITADWLHTLRAVHGKVVYIFGILIGNYFIGILRAAKIDPND